MEITNSFIRNNIITAATNYYRVFADVKWSIPETCQGLFYVGYDFLNSMYFLFNRPHEKNFIL